MSIMHHQITIMSGAAPPVEYYSYGFARATNTSSNNTWNTFLNSVGSSKNRCWVITFFTTGSATATHGATAKFDGFDLTQCGSTTTSLDRGRAISMSQWYLLESDIASIGTGVTPFQLSTGASQDGWGAYCIMFYHVNQTDPINSILTATAGDVGTNAPYNFNGTINDANGQMLVTAVGAVDPTAYNSSTDEIIQRSGYTNLTLLPENYLERSNDMGMCAGYGKMTSDPETVGWTVDYPSGVNIDALAQRGVSLNGL